MAEALGSRVNLPVRRIGTRRDPLSIGKLLRMLPGLDPTLLIEARQAETGPERLHLLQQLLRAVDADNPVSHETAPVGSAVAALSRARAVLQGHDQNGQPFASAVRDVCEVARTAVERFAAERGASSVLTDTATLLGSVSSTPANTSFREHCEAVAKDLANKQEDLEQLVRSDLAAAWTAPATDASARRLVARETAVLLLGHGRHERGIRDSLGTFLRDPGRSTDEFLAALFTPARRYRVALIVDGAEELRLLSELRPDAKQFALGTEVSGWGLVNDGLQDFADRAAAVRVARRPRRPGCLLWLEVRVPDLDSAAARGHRAVSELLDHYVAGHRLVDLTLREDILVNEIGRHAAEWRSRTPRSVSVAYPLSTAWPASLSEAMRMAHLARSIDSPLAAAGLSWSALEAAGLKEAPLADALALQTLRHRLVQTYSDFIVDLDSRAKAHHIDTKAAIARAEGLNRETGRLDTDHPAHADLLRRSSEADSAAARAAAARQSHLDVVSEHLAVLRAHVDWNERRNLADLNQWVDLLRPEAATDDAALNAARDALGDLLPELSPVTADLIGLWRWRLDQPTRCADWLEATAMRFQDELDWLYATRNLTFHAGQISLHGDVEMASAAAGLADLALEFLGSWYATAAAERPASSGDTPREIVEHLHQRLERIVGELRGQPNWTCLHAEHLTSCTSTGWDRRP